MVDMTLINDIWYEGKPSKAMWVLAFFPQFSTLDPTIVKEDGMILQLYFNKNSKWMCAESVSHSGVIGKEFNAIPTHWRPFPVISPPNQKKQKRENIKMKYLI